MTQYNLC